MLVLAGIATARPANAQQDLPVLAPAWEMHSEDGYVFLEGWPDCERVFVLTYPGDIQALDAVGDVAWSVNPGMSWPELAWASHNALWISDGAGIAQVDNTGELSFGTNMFAAGEYSGNPAVAAYVDIETGLIYGFDSAGACTWESAALAPDLRLASLVPAAGKFVVEANDFDNATQAFIGLTTGAEVAWRFDATKYGQMPVVGQYPVLRADGSLLLAAVTHGGELGGEGGEYGPLLSLNAGGELEWQYRENAYLLTHFPSADGSVHVVLPDYTIRRVDRDGRDVWAYPYDREDYLWDCLTQRDGGALVCFRLSDGEMFEQPTLRIVRISADGTVAGDWRLSRPEDTYWYLRQLGDLLVCLDGDYRLAAFTLP